MLSFDLGSHHDWAWFNGQLMPYRDVHVPLGAHALHYGTSAFEGIRAYRHAENGRLCIWKLDEHLDRLFESAAAACVTVPFGCSELRQAALEVVALNDDGQLDTLYLRPLAFMAVDPDTQKGIGVDPAKAEVWVGFMTQPWGQYLKQGLYQGGATVAVSSRARLLPAQAKTLKQASVYGLTSVPAKLEAKQLGATEAFCIDLQGNILDGTGQTVCAIVEAPGGGCVVVMPDPEQANILPGTTATFILDQLLPSHRTFAVIHVPALTRRMIEEEIAGLFFLGTATEVTPITRVWFNQGRDESIVGNGQPHPLTVQLQSLYAAAVHGRMPEYQKYIAVPPTRDEVLTRLGLAAVRV